MTDPRPLEDILSEVMDLDTYRAYVKPLTEQTNQLITNRVNEARIDELQWVKSLYPNDLLELNSWAMEEEIIARIKELKEPKE